MFVPLCKIEQISQGLGIFELLLRITTLTLLYIILSYVNTSIIWDILFSKLYKLNDNKHYDSDSNSILLNKLYNIFCRILVNVSIVTIILIIFNIKILTLYTYVNIAYLIIKTIYKLWRGEVHVTTTYLKFTRIDLHATILAFIALIYIILPILHKPYLIGDIRLHLMIIDGILRQGKIEPYLSKYDIMLTYSPGLHASYAFLIFITKSFNILFCFPFLVYGIYYLFMVMLTLILFLYTRSILQTTLAIITAIFVLPPAVGFHFFPAAHIFVFCFSALILLQLLQDNVYASLVTAVLTLFIHPVSGFALLTLSLTATLVKGIKNLTHEILKHKFLTIYIVLTFALLSFHFLSVFYGAIKPTYFTAPAAYSKVLSRNEQILYYVSHSGFDLFNYPWYVGIPSLHLSQAFIVLSIIYVMFSLLSKNFNIKTIITFRDSLFKIILLWHIIVYFFLFLSVKLSIYYLMPTSFNRIVSYSILFILVLVWTTKIATSQRCTRTLFYATLLLGIFGTNAIPIPQIITTYENYSRRVESFTYTINAKALSDIVAEVNNSDATIVIQVNAPISAVLPLFNARKVILLQYGIKEDLLKLPELILKDPQSAYRIMIENNISYYIMYFPRKYDSWIIKYMSMTLYNMYNKISNPQKLYNTNRANIREYFIIVYEKYNYVVLTPLHKLK